MEDQIIRFSNMLRQHGLRLSVSENMDAVRALELLGIEDLPLFRNGLRSVLVKQTRDVKTFDELFDLYFLGIGTTLRESQQELMNLMGMTPQEFQDLLDEIEALLKESTCNMSPLARAILSGDRVQVERLIRQLTEQELGQNPDTISMMALARLTGHYRLHSVEAELKGFRDMLFELRAKDGTLEQIIKYVDHRLQHFSQILRDLIHRELQRNGAASTERGRPEDLLQKSFAYYTEEDILRMNEAVSRLAQLFKNRLSVRRKRTRSGRFNVKQTLRKNIRYNGVPFQIQLDRRKKNKPQIMLLCDISDSVLNTARFMLQFVYSVQELSSKVRSFVFVSDLEEVTQLFEENGIHLAVDKAVKGDVIDVYAHSNFGHAFELFHRNYLSAVTCKTSVLIIGDGRNNYNRPNEAALSEIQQKAKRVIWLNPESRLTWGVGDSEMLRYRTYCDSVEECRNINQLYKVIDRIVP